MYIIEYLSFLIFKDHIIEIALTEGRKQLHNGEPSLAFPPSLLALKLLTETHGSAHIQLTPALLLLAQSAIGKLLCVYMRACLSVCLSILCV